MASTMLKVKLTNSSSKTGVSSKVPKESLVTIVKKLLDADKQKWFHQPVDLDAYPTYKSRIEKPMDLGTVLVNQLPPLVYMNILFYFLFININN